MTPEDYARVVEVFQAVIACAPEGREECLSRACAGDVELRRDVEAMLAADEGTGGVLASPPFGLISGALARLQQETLLAPGGAPGDRVDDGLFPAGLLIASRYRIISLLGRGGMGEVYRASDLKLGQDVALKFLRRSSAGNAQMIARLHEEVRVARKVTHPNVCRVYDIGEIGGSPFITMEYVDGEDLSSLLRRIGRLPVDKANEIARGLCAGLAAAHHQGVLHRDLKPANIMIDGRGQVLITDFGLAAKDGQVPSAEIAAGTPRYLAPEQAAGREVSVRSDIYALGLVLYEMYTGRRAFQSGPGLTHPPVSAHVKDIDPGLDRLIARCLNTDPGQRPASALAVAAAVPGADPLALALAVGETPSPNMVAFAGVADALPVRGLILCLGLVVFGLVLTLYLGSKVDVLQLIQLDKPPAVLVQNARDIIASLGYPGLDVDHAFGFSMTGAFRRDSLRPGSPGSARKRLARGQPPPIVFWYRQSPRYLLPVSASGVASEADPPLDVSGMVHLRLDPRGGLVSFAAVPPQMEKGSQPTRDPPDSRPLFLASALEPSRFKSAEPEWAPLAGFDLRAAWTGSFASAPEVPVRIEAAWWRGKPVYFSEILPWSQPGRMQRDPSTYPRPFASYLYLAVVLAVFVAASLLSWRHFRNGRGDSRGAGRLAVFAFCSSILEWMLTAKHVPDVVELNLLASATGSALARGAVFWVLYMALEPYVRRRWPRSLVSWSRLLAGGFRDPVVGGHLLIGTALGAVLAVTTLLPAVVQQEFRLEPQMLAAMLGFRSLLWNFLVNVQSSIVVTLVLFLLFFILRLLLRRNWLAGAAWMLLTVWLGAMTFPQPAVAAPFGVVSFGLILLVLLRFGILPLVAAQFVMGLLAGVPVSPDFSAWYAGATICALGVVLVLTVYSFVTGLAGRPLIQADFLED